MASAIDISVPATDASLVSAPVRANFVAAAGEITALQNQSASLLPAGGGVSIPPAPIAGVGPQARLGMNTYIDPAGNYHYVDNGPAAMISVQPSSPAGPGSRISVAVADINSAGAGALIPGGTLEGLINVVYGPVGGGAGNGYVVIGDATHIPGFQPPGDSLICGDLFAHRVDIAWAANPLGADVARIGFNAYSDAANVLHHLSDGPAYTLTCPRGSHRMLGLFYPDDLAGAPTNTATQAFIFEFDGPDQTPGDATNMLLIVARGTTQTFERVMVGPNDSAGAGRRALYIPN